MPKDIETMTLEQLMAEADALIQHIDTNVNIDKEEALQMQLEMHTQHLGKLKSEVLGKTRKKRNSGAEGMHAAIVDITKALRDLGNDLS